MKGNPIDHLVFEVIFPKPKLGEPRNFYDLLRRHLVPEVRSETTCFYGSVDGLEAQYPGLDYSYPPHRTRLSRYTWHQRLFRAFDALGLTSSEIAGLAKWEGTKWAKERYEMEHGIKIRDTTGDCIHDWVDPELCRPSQHAQMSQWEEKMQAEYLRTAAALFEANNATTVMEKWEQWLKNQDDDIDIDGVDDAEAGASLGLSNVPG